MTYPLRNQPDTKSTSLSDLEDQGFVFEPGDWSVGIQEGWDHFCDDDGDPTPVSANEVLDHYEGEGASRVAILTTTLTCGKCGKTATFTQQEWDPEWLNDND